MFYQRLHEICKSKGTTVTKMVKELGLSSANMSNWKKGRLPKTEIAFKIANYLDVTVYDLMGEKPKLSNLFCVDKKTLDKTIDKIIESASVPEKNPSTITDERIRELYELTADLSEDDVNILRAFVAGLKANRKNG